MRIYVFSPAKSIILIIFNLLILLNVFTSLFIKCNVRNIFNKNKVLLLD